MKKAVKPFFGGHITAQAPRTVGAGTEYSFRTPEACFEHGGLQKMRRVPQEPVLRTARTFRTVEGPLRYRSFQTARKKESIA